MVALLLVISGCGKQLTRMEENQVKLQAMVAANARELATLSSQIHAGTGKLQAGIQDLDADTQAIATHVQTVQDDQRKLQETVVAGNQSLDARANQLREGQQSLENNVAQVQTVADRTASDLGALSQRHATLHETVQANQRELNGRMGAVVTNQETIQAGITNLQQADAGLAKDIATVSARQDAVSAQVQDNHKLVVERLATLIAGQERFSNDLLASRDALQNRTQAIADKLNILEQNQLNHQTGLDRLFATANQTAATITTIAAAQTAMQESLNANHEQTAGRLTAVAESQRNMQASLDTLNAKADKTAADSTAAATSLHESLRTGREAIAGRIDVSLQNQQALRNEMDKMTATAGQTALAVLTMNNGQATFQQAMQTGMGGLHERADQTATEIRGMAERQTAFQDSIKTSNETLVARTSAIEANQQALNAEIGKTAKVIDRAYADLTGVSLAQDTLQTTFAKHSDQVNDRMARIENSQKSLGDGQDVLVAMTGQTAIDILALTNGHTDIQRSIKSGNETVLSQTAALDQNQKTLASQLDVLTATAGQTALDVLAIEGDQTAMARNVQAGIADLGQRTDAVAANQQKMQAGLDAVATTTGQTAQDVTAVAARQDALQTAVQGYSDATTGQIATLAENQQKTQAGLDAVATTTSQTAQDVTAVAGRQDALQTTVQGYSDATTGQIATLAENQQKTQAGLDTVAATTSQTAQDVTAVAARQDALQTAIQGYSDATTGQIAMLAEDQQKTQAGLDTVAATTSQTAQDVTAVAGRQDALQTAVQNYSDATTGQIATLAESQQKTQASIDTVAVTTSQTAQDVTAVAARQDALQTAIQGYSDATTGQIATLAESQQKIQTGLDTVAATTSQTAQDVTTVTARQDALRTAIQGYSDVTVAQMTAFAENQQKMQVGLDTVTTTTGQTALDVATVSEGQAKTEQNAQAGRVEVSAKLEAIAQDQQGWLQRFDATQARIQAMADGIALLDQQIVKLQGTLQTSIQNTTTAADANGQQRQQFEAKIVQDVQAMLDAIAQLRQAQAQLQEQMGQVHKTTQSQAETLKATLDQIKQPPAEVKVSEAANPPQPVVVQSGQ